MRNSAPNVAAFVVLSAAVLGGYYYLRPIINPPPPPRAPDPALALLGVPREAALAVSGGAVLAADGFQMMPAGRPPAPPPPANVAPAAPAKPSDPPKLIALGTDDFYLKVLLTARGAGVQQVIATKFDDANRLGREEKDAAGRPRPLILIPGYHRPLAKYLQDEPPYVDLAPNFGPEHLAANAAPPAPAFADKLCRPSYTLLHYPVREDPRRPLDDKNQYKADEDNYPLADLAERDWAVTKIDRPAAGPVTVVFETDLLAPYFVKIRKTFTLDPKAYDFKMALEFSALPGRAANAQAFRYQIAGPVGMPIEGEWYTGIFRTSYVAWLDKFKSANRAVEDAATITYKAGGDAVQKAENRFLYMAVGTQYFASALAVDDPALEPWAYVRPTREQFPSDPVEHLGQPYDAEKTMLYDVSVRAAGAPLTLRPNEPVTHKYAVYNGPIKVRLLKQLKGDRAVDPADVDRYLDQYRLDTMTDFHSPNFFGRVANFFYWSDIVIAFTNVMHNILGFLHGVVGNWGISIMLLTVVVRSCLFLPSRRQQAITATMQARIAVLKPDLDKIKEKYKDDFLGQQQAQAELYKRNGISQMSQMPGCLLLFAQMPIFMGLYFCLQESVFFRLQEFLWIPNLAAPDMLAFWGENIPGVSSPGNRFGSWSFLYLGPFFNLLPFFSVTLFFLQQKLTMPPPTNDMEEQQRKMMKYMLVITGVFFYKVAAGLCLYFIVSGLWTLMERTLIPKPKPKPAVGPGDGGGGGGDGTPAAPPKPPGMMGRFQERLRQRMEEMQAQAEGQRQIRNDGKPFAPPPPSAGERADRRKKKKRK